jgi:hypothetical protein
VRRRIEADQIHSGRRDHGGARFVARRLMPEDADLDVGISVGVAAPWSR